MAGSVGGYDSAAERAAELARQRAEEARRKAAEEETRRKVEEEARRKTEAAAEAREAQELAAAEEVEAAQREERIQQTRSQMEGSVWDGVTDWGQENLTEQELEEQLSEWEELSPNDNYYFLGGHKGTYSYYTTDGTKITVSDTRFVHVKQNKLTGEVVVLNAPNAKVEKSSDSVQVSFEEQTEEERRIEAMTDLAQWAETYEVEDSEFYDPNSDMNQAFKKFFNTDMDMATYYSENRDRSSLQKMVGFFDWYNTSYQDVNNAYQEMAATQAYALSHGIPFVSNLTLQGVTNAPQDMYAFSLQAIDYRAGDDKSFGYNYLITGENGVFGNVEEYTHELSQDEYGNTVSTINFMQDGQEVIITTVFDNDSTRILSQTQLIGEETTSIKYNPDGSFVVRYPNGTDKTSEEITLARINSYGMRLDEDMAGNNELSQILVGTSSIEETYEVLTAYCGGDKSTARKLFNALYAEDGLMVDDKFVLRYADGKEILYEENPLYKSDQTAATAKLFDYRAQDRVLSADILRAFSTTSKKQVGTDENDEPIYEGTLVVNGVDTGFPESGTEYYIDAQGNLCLNKYTMSSDDNLNLYMTSVVTNTADDSPMYTETALYYIGANGEQRVSIYREDAEGQPLASFDETIGQYQKRVLVERNYSPDADGDTISELNLSSDQIEQLYSLKMKDGQYSDIIMQYGGELNSQGFFDHVHSFLKGIFDRTGINTERMTEEVYATTSMVPVMENFVAGKTEEALEATQQEFERRIQNATSIQDVYDEATRYFGDQETAYEFVQQYVQNNPKIVSPSSSVNAMSHPVVVRDESDPSKIHLEYSEADIVSGIAKTYTTDKITGIDATNLGIENFDAHPTDFNSLYTFWTRGGDYTPENIAAYQSASGEYSAYNEGLMSAQYMDEALASADSPEKVFEIFRQGSETDEEAIEKFNNFYANIFEETGSIPVTEQASACRCTGITAQIGPDGKVVFSSTMTDCHGNPVSCDEDQLEINMEAVNDYIVKNKINEKRFILEYKEQYLPDLEIPEDCEDEYQFITQHVNDTYFSAYEKLYGDTELKNILNEYITDMDTYASRLTQIVQMGSIGLSFVCPAFGMVAMASGFIDNGIDLVNMATNKRADNYGEWLKQTAFEAFCVVGGMALGGLCNRIGGKVTEALLTDSSGVAHPLRAQIIGTATEVGLDVTSGMAFDYATNMMMYGEADWNFSGNMFSGMLDIISGMRGYHALKSSLDMSKITIPAAGAATLLIADGSGGQVEFKCAGVDPNGRLVYSDGTGRVVVFDDSPDSPIKPSDVTQSALEGIGDNPYIAQRIQQEGLVYDPANGTYRNANMDEVKIETFTDANGTSYIRESVPGEGYSRILPTDNIRQGNDANCGFLSTVNSELRTQQGVDSMFDAVREYPGGELRVVTPDGREIRLDAKADATGKYNLSEVYGEALTKVTGASGGFADDIASGMGLNPVRVEPGADGFSRGQLDNMAQMVSNGDALSVGVRYPDGTGHYMTVEAVDPETGNMRVVDPATGETRTINVNNPDGEFKVEEIAGGSTSEVSADMHTPRPEGSGSYGAVPQTSTSEVDPYQGKIDEVEISPDGKVETISFANGEFAEKRYLDNKTITEYSDGRIVVGDANGSIVYSPADGTISYPSETGDTVTMDVKGKTVTPNPDGSFTISDGRSKPVTIKYFSQTVLNDGSRYWFDDVNNTVVVTQTVNGVTTKSTIPQAVFDEIPVSDRETWIRNAVKKAAGERNASGWKNLKGDGIDGYMYEVKWKGSAYRLLGRRVGGTDDAPEFVWEVFENTH